MHQSKECPDSAPDATSYKMPTEADTIAAKPKTVGAVGPVGAVMPSSVLNDSSDSNVRNNASHRVIWHFSLGNMYMARTCSTTLGAICSYSYMRRSFPALSRA
jgi:hypothetical protein